MLLRVRLLNITLGNLLHHKVAIDDHVLGQLAASDTPLASNGQDADGRFGVDEGVNTVGDIGESQLVGCLLWVRLDWSRIV